MKCGECGSERTRKVRKTVPEVVGFTEVNKQQVPVIKTTVFVFGVCPHGHVYDLSE